MILSTFWGWWILIVCNCCSGTWDPPLWVVIFPSRGFFEVRSSERHLPGKLQLLGHLWMSVSARAASCPEGPGWFHNIHAGLTIRSSMNLKIDTFLKLPYLKGNIVPVPDLFLVSMNFWGCTVFACLICELIAIAFIYPVSSSDLIALFKEEWEV